MSKNICFWYPVCPMKRYYEAGKIEDYWVKNYCLISNPDCIRKQKESRGEYHPDNMLPDGSIRKNLK